MSNEDTFFCASGLIQDQLPTVFQHPPDGRKSRFKVPWGGREAISQPLIVIFEVREPDIHIVG